MLWLGVLLLAQMNIRADEIKAVSNNSSNDTLRESKYHVLRPPDKGKDELQQTEKSYGDPLEDFLQFCSEYQCNARLWSVCSCDKNCYKDSSCCPNALDDQTVLGLLYTDLWGCLSINDQSISVINKCPQPCNDLTTCHLCEEDPGSNKDQRVILPVTNPNNNYTYKNLYCAQCNEGKAHIIYETRFKCNDPNMMTDGQAAFQSYLHNQSCVINVADKRKCKDVQGIISNCSETWSSDNRTYLELTRWRCPKVYAPITVSGKVYRNPYCAVCHYETPSAGQVFCDIVQGEEVDVFEFSGGGQGESQDLPIATDSVCLRKEVYDPFRRQCRLIREILAPTMEDEIIANLTSLNPEKNDPRPIEMNEAPYEGPPLQPSPCKKIVLDGPEFKLEGNALIHNKSNGCSTSYEGGEYVVALDSFGDFAVVCASPPPNRTRALCVQNYCSRRVSGFSSCSCDKACLLTGSCCLDVFSEEDIAQLMEEDQWDCTEGSTPVIAVSKCPPSQKEEDHVKRLCEAESDLQDEPLLHLPVISENDQTVYRNIFCAKCHQVSKTVSFETEFQCRQLAAVPDAEIALEHFLQDDGVCNVSFSLPEEQSLSAPTCQTAGCSVCPESWHHSNKTYEDLIQWKCNNYLAPAYINGKCYKNEFCVICNGLDPRNEKIDCGVSKKEAGFSTESVLFIVG